MMSDETLDPRNWTAVRKLSHLMMDDALDLLQSVRERPAWQPMPEEAKTRLRGPLPRAPRALDAVYKDFKKDILPYPVGNIHPRFWGWAQGTGTVAGMLAEMLAAAMNSNSWGGDQSAVYVERQVIDWAKTLLGFPETGSGVVVSGGSMANLVGLAVARKVKARVDVRRTGMNQADRPLRIYCSEATHNSIARSADILGIGSDHVVSIPVNEQGGIRMADLRQAVHADRGAGRLPICVVGTAGTVGHGAIDPLTDLAAFCRQEGLWFHVDGAIGAALRCSKKLAALVDGIESADSVAFDFHKWFFVPYEAGCVVFRDYQAHKAAFESPAHYLLVLDGGIAARGEAFFNDLGPELSRGMRALKVWMSIQESGIEKIGAVVEKNLEQAAYLAGGIVGLADFELMGPAPLNIVCFRFRPGGANAEQLNRLNRRLMVEIQRSGVAVVSPIIVEGAFGLRCCIMNHRTTRGDIDLFLEEVFRLASALRWYGADVGVN